MDLQPRLNHAEVDVVDIFDPRFVETDSGKCLRP